MTINLNERQAKALRMALHEVSGIAKVYRQRVADEDSILLLHNVQALSGLLGVEPQEVIRG